MTLFTIDSAKIQTALFETLYPLYQNVDAVFRVDGTKTEPGGIWYSYSNGKVPVFAGLDWLINSDTYTGWTTMVVTNMAYPMPKTVPTFKVDGLDATILFPFICQFMK